MSKTLGISKFRMIKSIILPLSRPAIFIGISLVAMETLSDFGTASFFGISTLTTEFITLGLFLMIYKHQIFINCSFKFYLIYFMLKINLKKKKFHDSL